MDRDGVERESRDERMERVRNYFLMTTRAESGIAAAGSGGLRGNDGRYADVLMTRTELHRQTAG